MTKTTSDCRSELLRDVLELRLMGNLREDRGEIVTFERTPLLLSKHEHTEALAGRAVWLEDPAGWFATDVSDIEALAGWIPGKNTYKVFKTHANTLAAID
ncbi:hypothetical protein [Burkholderia ubonensis]|uniref:hypothetical protein n=1 Tax=Burkholderia ubonensis TaxID=101571 RepID=UPI001160C49B|nr:hypothetical protein [Burkholderia ubonensis]